MRWQLNTLYHDFDTNYDKDILKLQDAIKDYDAFTRAINGGSETILKCYIELMTKIKTLSGRLKAYPYLRYTMNAKDTDAKMRLEDIEYILTKLVAPHTRFRLWLKEAQIDKSSIKDHEFHLDELLTKTKYMLSEEEENLFSQMNLVAGESWGKLQKSLSSSLKVELKENDEIITLPITVATGYLSHKDKKVREESFYSIQEAYETIEKPIAAAMSNIKRQGNMMADKRAYDSLLSKTLVSSRMSKETLDALLSTIESYLPVFRRYLKAKAKYLGYDGGIKMFDLSAPIGQITKSFSVDEGKKLVLESFSKYSDKLHGLAKKAFDESWVDFEPREGKRGGAFCFNMPYIGESRVSLNYNNKLGNVITLAHELGHAYHGSVLKENTALNWSYPMPLAESASLFCEQVILDHLMDGIDGDEKLSILELNAMKATRLLLGMLSRFWFEDSVIEETKTNTLTAERINELMMNAQLRAYGDAVDPKALSKHAWLTKPHYYYLDKHYYNFPYSFGFLYSKGLYGKYKLTPDDFYEKFDHMLLHTTKASVEDVARIMDIDVTDSAFWKLSLESVKKDIEIVCELLEK